MLVRTTVIGAVAAFVLALSFSACGGDDQADCVSRCSEAQGRNCTDIKGDCAAFCSAVVTLASKSNCGGQKDAYLSCTNAGDVCTTESRCASQENGLVTCAGVWCLANANDPDCATVTAALK